MKAKITWWNVMQLWRVKYSDDTRRYFKTLPEAHDDATMVETEYGILQ